MTKTAMRVAHVLTITAAFAAITGSARFHDAQFASDLNRSELIQDVESDAAKSARITRRAKIIGYWSGTRCA